MNSNTKTKPANFLKSAIPTNIPEQITPLIGRDNELRALESLISQKDINLITLTGLGGAGKTSLAIQLAYSMLEKFSSGVFFIPLSSITKPNLIPIEIAHVLKIDQNLNRKSIDGIKDFLLGRRILLILDNFEHLMSGASFVQELLQSSSNLKIIVTSREPLRLRSEQVYPIGMLDKEHALELFIKRAQSLNPNFFVSSADKESIIELCQRLDGLPLAIELAAFRTKLFTPSALLTRLKPDLQPVSRILNLFSSGTRDLPERQQSLRNTIAWSYELLEEQEKRIFRAASIFPAGFSVLTLSMLLNLDENQTLEIISSLVDKNLLKPSVEKRTEPHFGMVEMIREFAWDEIHHLDEISALKDAYVNLYLSLSQQADRNLKETQQINLFKQIDEEFENINLALEICITSTPGSKNWETGYKILTCFHRYWMMHQSVLIDYEYIARARKSIDEFTLPNPDDAKRFLIHRADIYSVSGTLAWLTGNYAKSREFHEIAYTLYLKTNHEQGVIESLNNLSANLGQMGDYDESLKLLDESTTLTQKLGDHWAEMRNLANMGILFQYIEKPELALEKYEQCLKIAQDLNDDYFKAIVNYGKGHLNIRLGNYETAIEFLKINLDTSQQIQGAYIFVYCLAIYARANIQMGKVEPAIHAALEAISLSEKITDVEFKIELLYACIYIFIFLDLYSESVQLIGVIQKVRDETKMHENPYDVRDFEKKLQKIYSSMSPEEFESLRLAGSKLTVDSALAIAAEILEAPRSVESKKQQPQHLTSREQEVLNLIAQGLTNEQISNELVVVLKTVEKHVASIFRKLGVRNRTEAAAWALENKITV